MAKVKISDFSSTPGNNTEIDNINISEGCAPSGINDAIRELMAQLKDFQTGAAGDSFNGPVGTTTAAAGAFTNLTASGTLGVTGATTLSAALTYGGVTLSNAVTGTGNMVLSASPTLTGTLSGANASLSGTLAVTGVATLTAQPILSSLTASRAVFTDGSKGLVSNAITGTGNVVMSASPTLTGTITAEALTTSGTVTVNGGTANAVVFLNGSKVLTTGSALTFDGATLTNTRNTTDGTASALTLNNSGTTGSYATLNQNAGTVTYQQFVDAAGNAGVAGMTFRTTSNHPLVWGVNGSEQMRLTSTGLGIGTSSPDTGSNTKLTVKGIYVDEGGNDAGYGWQIVSTTSGAAPLQLIAPAITFSTGANLARSVKATLDPSGNLGLGVTPSAWNSGYTAFQIGNSALTNQADVVLRLSNNMKVTSSGVQYINTGTASQYEQATGQHAWYTAPSGTAGNAISFTQAMTLTAAGDLLVGTTSNIASGYRINIAPASSQAGGIAWKNFDTTGTSPFAVFLNSSGSVVGSIDVGNAATVYSTSSDYRLKNITGPITTSGAYIDSLNPVEGTWKADGSTFVGLIAHEVQEASRTTVATGVKDGEEMQGMDYSSAEIIANLIAEVKSLRQRLAAAGI